jgi:N-acetylglucosamine-6-phosphate deacetylase
MTLTLHGRDPYTLEGLEVTVVDGRIAWVRPVAYPEGDLWLAPGLVDLQVNGFAGIDVNASGVEPAAIAHLVEAEQRLGVTTIVPTVVTGPEEHIIAALRAIGTARAMDRAVAHAVPYVHVEGPFISAGDGPRGAHDRAYVRPADFDELDRWQRASDGLVGLVTVSPHSTAALEFIAAATARGVLCAVGHTAATPGQIVRAADAGARLSTHLGNGAHALLPRHPNYLWAQLAEDRLAAGFIADGHHLPADTFRAMLRAKGLTRAHLVSDSTAAGGLGPGRHRTPVGGEVEISVDGRVSLPDTTLLAGAARPLPDGVATAIDLAGLSVGEALTLATGNPGRFVGGRGQLSRGSVADVIGFRWQPGDRTLDIRCVVAAGQVVLDARG